MNTTQNILMIMSDGDPWTSRDVADRIGGNRRHARVMIVKLCEMGCLEASPVRYSATELGIKHLNTKARTGEGSCKTRRVLRLLKDGVPRPILECAETLKISAASLRRVVGALRDRHLIASTPVLYEITEKGLERAKNSIREKLPMTNERIVVAAVAAQPTLMRVWG